MNELSPTALNLEREGGPRPAWADVRPTSLPRRRRSLASTSCLFRRGGTGTWICGWSGDACTNEADRDRDCSSGRRLTGTTRRTQLRIADLSISLSNGSSNFSMQIVRRSTTSLHCEHPPFRNNHPPYRSRDMLVARCSWMVQRASSTVSLAPQQADNGLVDFSTRTFETRRSSAATPQHTSCSVTTLTSMRG